MRRPADTRVLIACKFTGTVRNAFLAAGFDAWSCDLLPSADGSNRHITGDAREHLNDGWDLLVVAHPPCTRLCNSGVRWLNEPPGKLTAEHYTAAEAAYAAMGRDDRLAFMWHKLGKEGAALFNAFWNAPIERVCVENPIMHGHARKRIVNWVKPQIVQPWWFGEPKFKGTGLYLRGLPPLVPTNKLVPPKPGTAEHRKWDPRASRPARAGSVEGTELVLPRHRTRNAGAVGKAAWGGIFAINPTALKAMAIVAADRGCHATAEALRRELERKQHAMGEQVMAAILGRPGGNRRKPGTGPKNTYVEDQGRRYRVCFMPYGRVLMVMLKCPAGGERALEPEGRRGRQIIRLAGLQP